MCPAGCAQRSMHKQWREFEARHCPTQQAVDWKTKLRICIVSAAHRHTCMYSMYCFRSNIRIYPWPSHSYKFDISLRSHFPMGRGNFLPRNWNGLLWNIMNYAGRSEWRWDDWCVANTFPCLLLPTQLQYLTNDVYATRTDSGVGGAPHRWKIRWGRLLDWRLCGVTLMLFVVTC
jgi:hypothetical protein